jgi:hypothetical protein
LKSARPNSTCRLPVLSSLYSTLPPLKSFTVCCGAAARGHKGTSNSTHGGSSRKSVGDRIKRLLLAQLQIGGLSTWWQQEIGSGHSTWALTVHVRHPMCVRCKELVCPCTPVLGISVKANDHPPPITSHINIHPAVSHLYTEAAEGEMSGKGKG